MAAVAVQIEETRSILYASGLVENLQLPTRFSCRTLSYCTVSLRIFDIHESGQVSFSPAWKWIVSPWADPGIRLELV